MKKRKLIKTLDLILRTAATVSVLALAGLGAALVGAQVLSLALGKGAWMSGASELLLKPACIAAAAAGFLSFLRTYTDCERHKGG